MVWIDNNNDITSDGQETSNYRNMVMSLHNYKQVLMVRYTPMTKNKKKT